MRFNKVIFNLVSRVYAGGGRLQRGSGRRPPATEGHGAVPDPAGRDTAEGANPKVRTRDARTLQNYAAFGWSLAGGCCATALDVAPCTCHALTCQVACALGEVHGGAALCMPRMHEHALGVAV
eukprot:351732-Chlamydomonas_euryale.AAC.19